MIGDRAGARTTGSACVTRQRRRTNSSVVTPTTSAGPRLDQLDPVAVRVLDEGDLGRAVLHGSGLAHDAGALLAELLAAAVDVVDAEGDVPEARADLVAVGVPVVGQLEDRRRLLLAAVPDEREREPAARIVVAAEE